MAGRPCSVNVEAKWRRCFVRPVGEVGYKASRAFECDKRRALLSILSSRNVWPSGFTCTSSTFYPQQRRLNEQPQSPRQRVNNYFAFSISATYFTSKCVVHLRRCVVISRIN